MLDHLRPCLSPHKTHHPPRQRLLGDKRVTENPHPPGLETQGLPQLRLAPLCPPQLTNHRKPTAHCREEKAGTTPKGKCTGGLNRELHWSHRSHGGFAAKKATSMHTAPGSALGSAPS